VHVSRRFTLGTALTCSAFQASFALLWLLVTFYNKIVDATASAAAGATFATLNATVNPQSNNSSSLTGSRNTIGASGRHSQSSLIPVLTASLARMQAAAVAVNGTASAGSHSTSKDEAQAYVRPTISAPPTLSFAALGSHKFAPLTDKDIALINIILKSRSPVAAKGYVYDTGLPPVEELLNLHTAAAAAAASQKQINATATKAATADERLSQDRMHALAQSSEPLGWLIRTFAVYGEALTKMRMTTELQLVIRDAISTSLAAVAQVPANQVLTFATSNVSLVLGFDGLVWPPLPEGVSATAHNYAGLAAVREALAQLSGGFDRQHISVAFKQPAESETPPSTRALRTGSAALPNDTPAALPDDTSAALPNDRPDVPARHGRSLQQTAANVAATYTEQSRLQGLQQHVEVCVTFHGMAPSNVTSLLETMSACTEATAGHEPAGQAAAAAAAAAASGSTVQSLAVGQPMTSGCSAVFEKLLGAAQVQRAQDSSLRIAAVDQPTAGITLSVAVGLTSQQTLQDVDEQTSHWLNSSALQDILENFNLSAESHEYLSLLVTPVGRQPLEGLPGLLPLLLPPGPTAAAPEAQQPNPAITRGILAGIIVAGITSLLALLSVGLLLLRKRQDQGQQQGDRLPTISTAAAAAAAAAGARRRKVSSVCCVQL
jgi:hypothetical protein